MDRRSFLALLSLGTSGGILLGTGGAEDSGGGSNSGTDARESTPTPAPTPEPVAKPAKVDFGFVEVDKLTFSNRTVSIDVLVEVGNNNPVPLSEVQAGLKIEVEDETLGEVTASIGDVKVDGTTEKKVSAAASYESLSRATQAALFAGDFELRVVGYLDAGEFTDGRKTIELSEHVDLD